MKKTTQRITCLLLVVASIVSMFCCTAFAADTDNAAKEQPVVGIDINDLPTVDAPVATRSTSIPYLYWNLAAAPYNGTLTTVGFQWLYTNYYFKANSAGRIYLNCTINPGAHEQTIWVGILDMSTNKIHYYTYQLDSTGLNINTYFYNLDTSKNYAVCWISPDQTHNYTYSGSAVISH